MKEPPSLEALLQQGPTQLYQWVQSIRAGLKQVSYDFNWLGLAEAAALRARFGNGRLTIIKTLLDKNQLFPNQQLSAWLALHEKLP